MKALRDPQNLLAEGLAAIREYVEKNPKAFARADAELIKALYVPRKKMKELMDADAERFRELLLS